MREILFRIWNKKEKRMLEDIHICPQYGWLVMSDNDALAEICGRVPEEDLIWMQYTGLRDKNGVKIFEGDIIDYAGKHCEVKYGEYYYSACDEYSCNRTGYYIDLKYQGYIKDNTGVPLEKLNRFFEVISNIYESKVGEE